MAIRYRNPYLNIGTGFDSRFSKSEGIISNRQGAKVAKEERDWEPLTRNFRTPRSRPYIPAR